MRIKRYVADDMSTAVQMVKADFGDDAVILHTKRFKRGGFFGLFGRPKVEILAAVEPGKGPRSRRARQLREAEEATVQALQSLQQEVQALKEMVGPGRGETLSQQTAPYGLRAAWERLVEQEIGEDDARRLLDAVVEAGSAADLENPAWVWSRLLVEMERDILTTPPWRFDRRPIIAPLVGPTGVGKTTTVAKLAANFKLLGERKVGLVTADTYRVAAVQQLRTYADIIDIDLHVVYTPEELQAAVEKLSDHDLILIDTAGRSQNHAMHMAELRSFLGAVPEAEVHLVVSASTRRSDLINILDRFASVDFARIIVTKLDETSVYGPLYELPRWTGKPLAYMTNGQSVPDDIEVADGAAAARLILGEAP